MKRLYEQAGTFIDLASVAIVEVEVVNEQTRVHVVAGSFRIMLDGEEHPEFLPAWREWVAHAPD